MNTVRRRRNKRKGVAVMPLDEMSGKELKLLAKNMGMKGVSSLNKANLSAAIKLQIEANNKQEN